MNNLMLFWLCVSLMSGVAVWFAIQPWLSRRIVTAEDKEMPNTSVYQERLSELEMGIDYPTLTIAQRDQEKRELMAELLEDVGGASNPYPAQSRQNHGRGAMFLIVFTLPITAIALYLWLGSGIYLPFMRDTTDVDLASQQQRQVIEQMLPKITAHLATNPNDQRAWDMLGRAYMALARYPEAVDAYSHALALTTTKDENLSADYIDALWLAGISAFQAQQYLTARDLWNQIKPLISDDAELTAKVTSAIADALQHAAGQPK